MIYHQGEDMWKSGANYDSYVGRWSRLVARQFVPWLNVSAGPQWLDIGCGTGNLSQTILDIASPHAVLGIDSSERYIEFAHKQIKDPRVTLQHMCGITQVRCSLCDTSGILLWILIGQQHLL
jgi:LSD1 subclass zinc finger protein